MEKNSAILKIEAVALADQAKKARAVADKQLNAALWARDNQKSDEEQFLMNDFWGLERFRTVELRRKARAVHLARAFIAGKPYKSVEISRRPNYEPLFLHTTLWDVAEAISEDLSVDLIKAWVNGEDLANV